MPTIRDVAREAGVSTATVSRAFTTPDLLNTQTMQRIQQAARHLGYQHTRRAASQRNRDSAASAAKGNSPRSAIRNAIGFQFFGSGPDDTIISNSFYAPILHGAQEQAAALGIHLLLHSTHRAAFEQELPLMVRDRVIDGLLLVGGAAAPVLSTFTQYVPNLLLVDDRDDTGRFESVLSDGFGGVYGAMQHLFTLGHREKIACFLPNGQAPTMKDRLRGYVSALFENGITPDPGNILSLPETEADWIPQIVAFLQSSRRPTAVLCGNDYLAHIVLRVCREFGIKVPDDLSVIGFDDIDYSSHCDPPLTTLRVEKEEMGRIAVRQLYRRITAEPGRPSPVRERHELPVTLILRDSCTGVGY